MNSVCSTEKEDSWSEIQSSDPSEVSDLKIQRECLRLVNGKEKPDRNHLSARQLPFCAIAITEKVNNLFCACPVSASSVMGGKQKFRPGL